MATLRVPVTQDDHIRGRLQAPAVVVEYGDFQCPYCRAAHDIVKAVHRHFGSGMAFVFRNFPLTEIHPMAEPAAETAEFAADYGRYWEMHDPLFENQEQLSPRLFIALARLLGLSETALQDALTRHKYASKIQADFMGGVRSGVNGTPTFFINGQRHEGPFDAAHLIAAIETHVNARAAH
jgi:protein-disulfide isomerase